MGLFGLADTILNKIDTKTQVFAIAYKIFYD
jgi:hypothetical protein